MPSAEEVLRSAERTLKASDAIDHPHAGKERYDAEELLGFVLGHEPDPDEDLPPSAVRRFERLLDRRERGEPTSYLTGRTLFRNLELRVGPGAFIPRESSEFLAEQAIRRLRARRAPIHVDLATGVGPVALAVASDVPAARVFGVDVSPRPVVLARRNARDLGLGNVRFLRGDLFAPLPRKLMGDVDVITIHPPYVRRDELKTLPREIRDHEPTEALSDRSREGLGLLGRVALEGPRWLRSGGWLLVEVSPDHARGVATLLRRGGYAEVRSTRGAVAVSRVIAARNPARSRRARALAAGS